MKSLKEKMNQEHKDCVEEEAECDKDEEEEYVHEDITL